ncbi:hypothetical protein DL765_003158 [Monosporascus sp. GIB2]|nr:hypothetical protein DL765_003158 [Monosporascus sp. GIB2]
MVPYYTGISNRERFISYDDLDDPGYYDVSNNGDTDKSVFETDARGRRTDFGPQPSAGAGPNGGGGGSGGSRSGAGTRGRGRGGGGGAPRGRRASANLSDYPRYRPLPLILAAPWPSPRTPSGDVARAPATTARVPATTARVPATTTARVSATALARHRRRHPCGGALAAPLP